MHEGESIVSLPLILNLPSADHTRRLQWRRGLKYGAPVPTDSPNKAMYKQFMSSNTVKFKKKGMLNIFHNVSEKITFYLNSVILGYKY